MHIDIRKNKHIPICLSSRVNDLSLYSVILDQPYETKVKENNLTQILCYVMPPVLKKIWADVLLDVLIVVIPWWRKAHVENF